MEVVTWELLAGWIDRQVSEFQAGAGIWDRSGWLPASPIHRTQVPIPPPRIQGFAKQAALTWKESDSGRQESWNESGRQGLSAWPPPRGPSLSQQEEHELVHRAHWVRGQSCHNVPLASQWGTAIILLHSLPHSRPARALARVLSCHAQISEPRIMETWVPALLLVLTSPGRSHGPQSPSLV